MLILLFWLVARTVVLQLGISDPAVIEQMGVIFITLLGISYLFSVMGCRINSGNAVVNGLIRGLGFFGGTIVKAIGWLLRTIIGWVPGMSNAFRAALMRRGMGEIRAMLLAGLMTFIIVVIII